jgi:hypothetical protein
VPAANQPSVSSASTDPNQDQNQVAQTTLGRTQNLVDTAPASGSHAHATNTATLPAPNHPGNHGTPLAVEDDGNGYVCIYISLTSYPFPNNNLFMLYILMRYYYLYFTLEKKISFTYIIICTRFVKFVIQKNIIIYL